MTDNTPEGTVEPGPDGHTLDEAADRIAGLLPEDEEHEDGAEDEADEGDIEADEPEGDDDDAQPTSRKWKVKDADGEEVEVDEEELLKGYSRQSDYTRKTQELAKHRKDADAELVQARAERQQYAQALQLMAQRLQDDPQVDWDTLYKTDPIEYFRQRDQQRQRQEQRQAVQAEQMRVAQQQQAESEKAMRQRLTEEARLLSDAIPQWKDAGKAKAEREAIRDHAVSKLGFQAEDIDGITDHRVVVALRKAWLYDQAIGKKDRIVQEAPKQRSANPTAPQPQQKRTTELKDRLRKSGSVDDAAALFATFIK